MDQNVTELPAIRKAYCPPYHVCLDVVLSHWSRASWKDFNKGECGARFVCSSGPNFFESLPHGYKCQAEIQKCQAEIHKCQAKIQVSSRDAALRGHSLIYKFLCPARAASLGCSPDQASATFPAWRFRAKS
eukprot:1052818-Pelagomonas_calceolata.AAC.4